MRYKINYIKKGGSIASNNKELFNLYNISNDLIGNILKYIDFKDCIDLVKIIKNISELEHKIDYKFLNEYNHFNLEVLPNYNNDLCDGFFNKNGKPIEKKMNV